MSLHLGKTALSAVILAEIGALTGAFLAWLFLVSWVLIHHGDLPRSEFLTTAFWAGMIGAPIGTLTLPLVGLTVLRKTPLRRALGLPLLGAGLGVLVAALSVHGPALYPLPTIVSALVGGGFLTGVLAARIGVQRLVSRRTPQLP